jgi:Cys-tRNA(Pro)/Cys-tRNA(Cys) deacylase
MDFQQSDLCYSIIETNMAKTNNITRLLETHKIPFTIFELPVEKLGALESAQLMGVSPEMVFKTIVITREKPAKPILAVVPGPGEVDLKALAQALGEKKVRLPSEREAETLTGLEAGGISPLALLNRGFLVMIDEAARQYDQIHISGGQRGLNIRLPVSALISLTHARVAAISRAGA